MTSVSCVPQARQITKQGWVYALFCESADGTGYVKIGQSVNPLKRLSMLAAASPFAPLYCGLCCCGGTRSAYMTEQMLHRKFAPRRTNGEWFVFDFRDPMDKAAFLKHCPKGEYAWRYFPYEALREVNRQEAKAGMAKGRRALALSA